MLINVRALAADKVDVPLVSMYALLTTEMRGPTLCSVRSSRPRPLVASGAGWRRHDHGRRSISAITLPSY